MRRVIERRRGRTLRAMDAAQTRAAVERYYAAVSAGDVDAIATLFAAGGVMRDPVGTPPRTTDAERRQAYAAIGVMFESFAITPGPIISAEDEAGATWTARARTRTGKSVEFDGISKFTFDGDGRIAAMDVFWDRDVLARALSSPQ
jgi:steroid delta-isomerase